MKYVKKLALVPIEEYLQLRGSMKQQKDIDIEKAPENGVTSNESSEEVAEVSDNNNSLMDSTMSESSSSKSNVGPFQNTESGEVDSCVNNAVGTENVERVDVYSGGGGLSKDIIISKMPRQCWVKTRLLLKYLEESPDPVLWNNRGDLLNADKTIIENANICDLVKDVVKEYKYWHPVGRSTFMDIVKRKNIPLKVIGNTKYKVNVQNENVECIPKKSILHRTKPMHKCKWITL